MIYHKIRRTPIPALIVFSVLVFLVLSLERDVVAGPLWQSFRISSPPSLITNAALSFEIGNYYFNWGGTGSYDIDTAERYYNRTRELNERYPGVLYQLGRIHFLKGRNGAAVASFDRHLSFYGDPEDDFYFNTYYMRGLTYGFMKKFALAERDFLHIFNLLGEDTRWAAYVDLAWVYFLQGRFGDMAMLTKKGVDLLEPNPWLFNMHGLALFHTGSTKEARQYFQQALVSAQNTKPVEWSETYPGNDPAIAEDALEEMIRSIRFNLSLVNK